MKVSTKYLDDTKVELTITVSVADLQAAQQVALKKVSRNVKAPGFRKGKIPLSVAEKYVDQNVLYEQTLESAVSKAVAEAFLSEKLQALESPAVEVKKFVPGKELEFAAEATIVPKVKLGNFKKLKTKITKVSVNDKDIDEVIERMRESFAEKTEVERKAKLDDEVNIDFVGKLDGQPFEGGSAKGHVLKLGANQFIPGFEEGIVGHKSGDKFDLDLKFPDDYHVNDLKGKSVVFETILNKVFETKLPEVNDEFAAKCGPFTSIDEFKAELRDEIGKQKEAEVAEAYREALVSELAEASTAPLPEILVEDRIRAIEQDFMQNLAYRGVNFESYLTTQKFKDKDQWLAKEVRPSAEKQVKVGLVIAQLSKELDIDVSRDEVNDKINELKNYYGKDVKMRSQFNDPDVHRDIANRLVTEKTIDKLVEISN